MTAKKDFDPDCYKLSGDVIAVDFETFYTSEYSLKELDYRTYCKDPRFDSYIMAAYDGQNRVVCHPSKFDWNVTRDKTVVAFNAAFDRTVYELGLGAPCDWPMKEFVCAMAACQYIGIPGSLSKIVAQVFGVTMSKEVRDKAKGVDFSKLEVISEDMKEYVAFDAIWCWKLWEKFGRFWPSEERICWSNTVDMGLRGFPTSKEFITNSVDHFAKAAEKYADALPMDKKLSRPQLLAEIVKLGLPVPETTRKDSPIFDEWLEQYGKFVPWLGNLPALRSANKNRRNMEVLVPRCFVDDKGMERCSYDLKYFGATTGRWAGGSKFNIQGLPREPKEGIDIRNIIQAPEGYKLIVSDFGQIEGRIILWLNGYDDVLELCRQGVDLYSAVAWIWKIIPEGEDLKKWDASHGTHIRNPLKAAVLGAGFAQGAAGLHRSNPWLTEEQCEQMIRLYRTNFNRVVQWWNTLMEIARAGFASPSRSFYLTLPSGRKIIYRNCYRKLIEKKNGQKAMVWVVDQGNRTAIINANLLSNNFVQGTARDLMMNAFNHAAAEDVIEPVTIVHDEMVTLASEDNLQDKARYLSMCMTDAPAWAKGLPLVAEPSIMDKYTKD